MKDVIERIHCDCTADQCDYRDAVAEIQRLRVEVDRLRTENAMLAREAGLTRYSTAAVVEPMMVEKKHDQ
jgi:hypothetical protein